VAITRDLWVVIRARDEASRIVRSFGHNVAGSAAAAAAGVSSFDRAMQTTAMRLQQFAMTSMLAGSVMTGFGVAGLAFIKSATNVAAEYDKQVRRTMTQIDGISTSLGEVAEVGRRVAREVGIPFEQMQETLFFIFSSMNVSVAEAETLLRGFAKEAVAGNSTIEAAARTTISIINALGLSVKDLTRIQDVQFQIVRKGIITYEELANTIGRALPAAARSGQTFETVGAMMAFLTRNGLSAAMAATSAARALESISHPKTVARLEDMGIAIRNAKGEFLPLVQIMDKMNDKIKLMSSPERAKFLQELFTGAGGTIQARRFWDVAFKNFGQFEEMVGFMQNATGVFEGAYETMAGSVAAKSQLIANKWMIIKEALGRAVLPELLKLITIVGVVLDWFDKLPEATKTTIAQFILWGSIIAIVVGVLVILVGTMAFFVSSIIAGGVALAIIMSTIGFVTVAVAGLTAAFYSAWQRSKIFRDAVEELGEALSAAWKKVLQTAKDVATSYNEHLRPSIEKLTLFIETRVIPAIQRFARIWVEEVMPKMEEARRIILDIVDGALSRIGEIIELNIVPALAKLSDWWYRNEESIRPFLVVFAQVAKWLLIITALILASGILGFALMIMTVVYAVVLLIANLALLWNWIKSLGSAIGDFFQEVGRKATSMGTTMRKFVDDLISNVKSIFSDSKAWLFNAGSNLISGFMDGIKSMVSNLKTRLKEITDMIPNIKGPKSVDLRLLLPAGVNIMKGFMKGISSQIPALKSQLQGITSQMGMLPAPALAVPQGFVRPITEQRVTNQYITVNTQEIDPRIHAAELGWELDGRL